MTPAATSATPVHVILEVGTKRVFASALEWPGWSRSGRDEAGALAALVTYADRYRTVARRARTRFPAHPEFEVIERLPGGGATDFGVPDRVAEVERVAPTPAEARRLAALVEAAWRTLDAVAAGAPASLRKGPRGGGRDRDAVVQHVLSPESASYARAIGLRLAEPTLGDREAIEASRAAILAAIRDGGRRDAPETKWPIRYAARRIAWHVLDHAWEIEDRSEG
ncbi:MAG: hypothetical protein AB7G21_12795 [Dehalococcoidia bacterium]